MRNNTKDKSSLRGQSYEVILIEEYDRTTVVVNGRRLGAYYGKSSDDILRSVLKYMDIPSTVDVVDFDDMDEPYSSEEDVDDGECDDRCEFNKKISFACRHGDR